MQVKVLFFGQLRELVGADEEQVELPEGACVADLLSSYQKRIPRIAEFRPRVAVAVNQEYAQSTARLAPGDEVAFLPPVSGGSQDRIELTPGPIPREELVAWAGTPQDGAVVVFDGLVRNHTGERKTLFLDYEAYEPMALNQMRNIVRTLRQQYPVTRVALVHRLGRLQIGETSVLIVVSAPHRAAAFDACRFAIEQLKASVPIWKKEYFAGGEVWVEGELPAPCLQATPATQEK